jgi:hypothetical protein
VLEEMEWPAVKLEDGGAGGDGVAGGEAAGDVPRAGLAGSSIEALQAMLQGRRDASQQVMRREIEFTQAMNWSGEPSNSNSGAEEKADDGIER